MGFLKTKMVFTEHPKRVTPKPYLTWRIFDPSSNLIGGRSDFFETNLNRFVGIAKGIIGHLLRFLKTTKFNHIFINLIEHVPRWFSISFFLYLHSKGCVESAFRTSSRSSYYSLNPRRTIKLFICDA